MCNQKQCMRTGWNMHDKLALESTKQAGPLNLCTKRHWNSFSLWLWHHRETENERGRQREMSIMMSDNRGRGKKTPLGSHNRILLEKKIRSFNRTEARDEHLVILFTNVTLCLDAIQWDIYSSRGNLLLRTILHLSVITPHKRLSKQFFLFSFLNIFLKGF